MNSRLMLFLGAAFSIVCAWLPWATIGDEKFTGFLGEMRGNPGILPIGLGVLIAIMALIGKKWSAIVAILLSLCVIAFGVYEYTSITKPASAGMDAETAALVESVANVGYGLYIMIAGGVIALIGGIMGMKGKTVAVSA